MRAALPTAEMKTIASLTACKVVGLISATLLPLLVPALIAGYGLTASNTGLLVSGQMICFAASGFVVSLIVHRVDRRRLAALGLATICVGNALCLFVETLPGLFAGRLIIGCGEGVLTAATTAAAAGTKMPERVFGLFAAAIAVITAAVLYILPSFIVVNGASAIFIAVLIIAAIAAAGLVWFPSGIPPATDGKPSGSLLTLGWPAGAVLLAACMFSIGMGTVQTYLGVVGGGLGASTVEIGRALALGSLFGIGVSLGVVAVGTRLGRVGPLAVGGAVLIALALITTNTTSVAIFLLAAMFYNPVVLLLSPFQYGLMAFMDKRGRIAAAAPVFIKLGFSIGPALGGIALDRAGTGAMGAFGATWILFGIGLYTTMAWLSARWAKRGAIETAAA